MRCRRLGEGLEKGVQTYRYILYNIGAYRYVSVRSCVCEFVEMTTTAITIIIVVYIRRCGERVAAKVGGFRGWV